LDLPGFGGSPAPKTPFTLSDYADIVSGFIKKMNLIKVNLVGHSFGGRVGIKLSAAKPELISRLVLVDSAGFADSGKQKVKLLAKLVKPLFAPKFMQGVRKWIYEKMGSEDYLATPELQKTFVNIIEEDLSSDLSCIQFPTLLIWGENDQDTPDSYGKRMQSIIRNSQFVILPNAGHFSFLDNPEGFYNAVSQFIH
jgi:pimeloyl-ACP methyl ester carboxylesterase